MLGDLCPPPILSIGLTGHRKLANHEGTPEKIENAIGALFDSIADALVHAVSKELAYFASAPPTIRLVTMGAEGADFFGSCAALKRRLNVAYILPFAWNDYKSDFSSPSLARTIENLKLASSVLELPGTRDEGPRAYERANNVILSNIDLLIAVWDSESVGARAGTADVVTAAVTKGIRVVVIDPHAPATPSVLLAPWDDVEISNVSALARSPVPLNPVDLVHRIIRPPVGGMRRQGLTDLLAEKSILSTWRQEYPLLLKATATKRSNGRAITVVEAKAPTFNDASLVNSILVENDHHKNAEINRLRDVIDKLAVRYGQLFRSSSAGSHLYVIFGVWLSGAFGLLFPKLSAFSISLQVMANIWVLADSAYRIRGRWQERWLDYRVVAERLRWLNFRGSFGLGSGTQPRLALLENASWTDWYINRWTIAVGPPNGKIDSALLSSSANYLVQTEIPEQIRYHRKTFRQLNSLEKRLSFAAKFALAVAAGIGALLAIAAWRAGGLDEIGWKPFAIVMLASLPGTTTALNGLLLDADLVRLVERSAQTVALLMRVRRTILAGPPDYDHIAPRMERLAAIMGNELAEWRFAIEGRRAREARKVGRKRRWLRVLRRFQNTKRSSQGDRDR